MRIKLPFWPFKRTFPKWVLWAAAPLILVVPISGVFTMSRYFKTIIVQPQKIGITTLNLHDASRDRPITTEVWYPVDADVPAKSATGFWIRCDEARDAPPSKKQAKYPLIVMSHGHGGDRFNISWIAEALSANGYIVAAMDHWGNTWNNKIPESCARPWERPRDISFVIEQLTKHSKFKDYIDSTKIGFTGYSLGGATGIWVAGAEAGQVDYEQIKEICSVELAGIASPELLDQIDFTQAFGSFKDPRIRAALVMAPALGWLFSEESLQAIEIPVFIVAPEKDPIVPAEKNAIIFANQITRSSLKMLRGDADHYIFLNRATAVGRRFLEPKLFNDPSSVDRKKVHEELARNAVKFFNENLQ